MFCRSLRNLLLILPLSAVHIQSSAQDLYRQPPKSILDVIDATPEPSVSFSPDTSWMVLVDRPSMPSIAEQSRRWLGLAGLRVDPVYNSNFVAGYPTGLSIRKTDDPNSVQRISLPEGTKLSSISWSHNSRWLVVSIVSDKGTDLMVVDPAQPANGKTMIAQINPLFTFVEWMPDGNSFCCCVVPPGRGPEPIADKVPKGPNIQESIGNKSPTRTFPDLLASDHDETLFEYFSTSQIVLVNATDGQRRTVFGPAMVADMSVSPNAQYLLVESIQRPFSRLMTANSFPTKTEVVSLIDGRATEIVSTPLAENIPIEGVPTWPRNIAWRPDQSATLVWAEALDGGDPRTKTEFRDKVMMRSAPFTEAPIELCRTQHRFMRLSWTEDPVGMLCFDFDRDRRWIRAQLYDANDTSKTPQTVFDRSVRDRYGDPGNPITVPD